MELQAIVSRTLRNLANGLERPSMSPDGALLTVPSIQRLIDQGHGYQVDVGSFSTPLTGGGDGTIVDADQPEVAIAVPAGMTIKPFRITAQGLVPLLASDEDEAEIVFAVDKDVACAFAGTWTTAETPINLLSKSVKTSKCTCKSACSANEAVQPTSDFDLARVILLGDVQGTAATALWTKLDLLYEPLYVTAINGPATIVGYWGGTVAVDAFAQICWVEYETGAYHDLT